MSIARRGGVGARRGLLLVPLAGVILGLLAALQLVPGTMPAPANAHATIVSTTPQQGASLDTAPSEVRVVFDEPVTFAGLAHPTSVIDERGGRVDAGGGGLDASRTVLTIPLRASIPDGVYISSWRVVSADSHPVGGSIQFGVGVPATATFEAPLPEPSPVLALAVGVSKGVLYLGMALGFGTLPVALLLRLRGVAWARVRRSARIGLVVAALASLGQLALQFLWTRSATVLPESVSWDDALGFLATPYSLLVYVRFGLLVLASAVLWRAGRDGRPLAAPRAAPQIAALALGVGVVCTVVANGHGGGGSPLIFVSTALHAAAAMVWGGGLWVLRVAVGFGFPRSRRDIGEVPLERMPAWSLLASGCVALLVISGTVQSVRSIGFPEALIDTRYGAILLVKLTLVAAALLLGAFSYWALRRELRADAPQRAATLRRIRLEAGIVAAIVLVSGVLSQATPAKDEWAPSVERVTQIGPYEVALRAAPTRIGPQSFRIEVTPPAPNFPQPERLEVSLGKADGSAGSLQGIPLEITYRIPEALIPGEPTATTFVSAAASLPEAGRWQATVTIVVSRMEQYSGTVSYEVY